MVSTFLRATPMVTPPARRSSTTVNYTAIKRSHMPVRSLSSPVLVWPKKNDVVAALRTWAGEYFKNSNVVRIGYFGSLTRNDYGVGSDADVVIVVKTSDREWRE